MYNSIAAVAVISVRLSRQFNDLAVHLILNQTMHVAVPRVVPHATGLEFERVGVLCLLEVVVRVTFFVPRTPHVAAHDADPQRFGRAAAAALRLVADWLHVATDRTHVVFAPPCQAFAVTRVVAQNCQDPALRGIQFFYTPFSI